MKKMMAGLLAGSLLSGCALVAGPRAPHYKIEPGDANKERPSWTDFESVAQAKARLRNVSRMSYAKARNITYTTDAMDDVSAASVLAGALGGALKSPDVAIVGAGISTLLGMGAERYKPLAQRENLLRVGQAFECLYNAVDGMTDRALLAPLVSVNEQSYESIDYKRRSLLGDLSRSAEGIENAFIDAMADIKMVQPDVGAIEQAIGRRKAAEEELVGLLPSAKAFRPLGGPSKAETFVGMESGISTLKSLEQKRRLLEAERRFVDEQLYVEKGRQKPEGKPEQEALKKKIEALQARADEISVELKENEKASVDALKLVLRDTQDAGEVSDTLRKLQVFNEEAAKCRALVSAKATEPPKVDARPQGGSSEALRNQPSQLSGGQRGSV